MGAIYKDGKNLKGSRGIYVYSYGGVWARNIKGIQPLSSLNVTRTTRSNKLSRAVAFRAFVESGLQVSLRSCRLSSGPRV